MGKTKEETIVKIFRQFTPANKGNFMKMPGMAVNAEHDMRTSMENEQAAEVFANRQEFEGWVYTALEQKRGRNVFGLYGNGIMMTERVLDYLWERQIVTLNNTANVDMSGPKAQYMIFGEELAHRIQNAAKRPNPRNGIAHAIGQTRVGMNITWAESSRLDDNSVGMGREQVELVRTVYEYQYMFSSVNGDINRLKSAVKIL